MAQVIQLDDIPLGWKDFQGKEASRSKHTAAHISLALGYGFRGIPISSNKHRLSFTTKIALLREKSWINQPLFARLEPREQQTLLGHEKGHLMIGLIYYKTLKQAFDKGKYKGNIKRKVHRTFNKINAKMNRYHKAYDKKTNHGSLKDEQQRWNRRLLKQLNEQYSLHELLELEI